MVNQKKAKWPWILGGIVGVLVIAGVIAARMLDSIILERARAEADTYSKQLGRPIRIGSVSTTFLTGLGARVEDVEVGAGPGEDVPLAKVERVEVKLALLQAVRSKGKDVEIHSAEIEGFSLNVIRFPDGSTNVEKLQARLEEQKKSEPTPPGEEEKPTDLSMIRVDHVSVTDGTIRFTDRSVSPARELTISKLGITVNDLRAGKPLDVLVKAAVLAPTENFELKMHSTPLPNTLQPTPESVTIKVQPIDLAPLAPFFPRDMGFISGRVDADLSAQLGAAVPGGKGETKVTGTLHALGMNFKDQEGGKPLDVVLETDVSGDVAVGALDLRKLVLKIGPAGINGKGKVTGLMSETPSVQGLEIVGENLDPAVIAQFYPPLKKQLKGQVSGPIGLSVRASGSEKAQTVALKLDFTSVKLAVPQQLSKDSGAPMTLTANILGGASGAIKFDATMDLEGVDLRPGESVNKKPGEPLKILLAGTYKTVGSGDKNEGSRIELAEFKTSILDMAVAGKGTVEMRPTKSGTSNKTFNLDLNSSRLDLDRLLIPAPEPAPGTTGAQAAAAKKKEIKKPEEYAGLNGQLGMKIGTLVSKKIEMQNVVMAVKMTNDLITVETLTMTLYGGQVNANGTTMRLAGDSPFDLKAQVTGVNLAPLIARRTPKQILAGTLDASMALKGSGSEKVDLLQSLAGAVSGNIGNGEFLGKDLLGGVLGPLAKALPFGSKAGNKVNALSNSTALGKELPFGVELENGVAKLKKPIQVSKPEGSLSFDGGIGLDGLLNLAGTVLLPPATVSALTGGRANLTEPVPVGLKLTGPAWAPTLTDIDVKPAVTIIAKAAAAGLATQLLGEKGKIVGDVLQGNAKAAAEEAARGKQKEAEQRVAEERVKAEAKAREEADRLKKRAEEEAAKKLKGIFGR